MYSYLDTCHVMCHQHAQRVGTYARNDMLPNGTCFVTSHHVVLRVHTDVVVASLCTNTQSKTYRLDCVFVQLHAQLHVAMRLRVSGRYTNTSQNTLSCVPSNQRAFFHKPWFDGRAQ